MGRTKAIFAIALSFAFAAGGLTVASAATSSGVITYATSATATTGIPLNSAKVSGRIYVFIPAGVLADGAGVAIDGRTVASSITSKVVALDTSKLAAGNHQLSIVLASGETQKSVNATFTEVKTVTPAPVATVPVVPVAGLPKAPQKVCGTSLVSGPATPPAGATTVPAGNNSKVNLEQAGKTFWFAPGIHTLGTGQYDQIDPANNSSYIGGPGAIIDGQKKNESAFDGKASGVTIKYLTVRNFVSPHDQGVVNHDQGHNWTITNNTFTNNDGAAVFASTNNVVSNNCLANNGQYGFQAFEDNDTGPSNIIFDHNEVAGNNTDDTEKTDPGCGCSGGGKFWMAHNVKVTNNYVHDNKGVGLWADTNDSNFLIQSNWIEGNDDEAIMYEISYNIAIRNNVIRHNALAKGNGQDDKAAIYISESGGDKRVNYSLVGSPVVDISGNLFDQNQNGILVWENADRYCNSPDNSSTGVCTLVNPKVTTKSCVSGQIANAPLYDDCRWKSQNVKVHNNTFIGRAGATDSSKIYSNYGTDPSWSPYKAYRVIDAITTKQGNQFSNNTYSGSWKFNFGSFDNVFSAQQWQAKGQDTGSTFK